MFLKKVLHLLLGIHILTSLTVCASTYMADYAHTAQEHNCHQENILKVALKYALLHYNELLRTTDFSTKAHCTIATQVLIKALTTLADQATARGWAIVCIEHSTTFKAVFMYKGPWTLTIPDHISSNITTHHMVQGGFKNLYICLRRRRLIFSLLYTDPFIQSVREPGAAHYPGWNNICVVIPHIARHWDLGTSSMHLGLHTSLNKLIDITPYPIDL